MGSKFFTVVNWSVLAVITFVAVWMVLGFSSNSSPVDLDAPLPVESCVDIEKIERFEYEACYDAYSEMIFLKATRGKESYNVKGLEVSFVDLSSQFYVLEDVPSVGSSEAYKLSANKNPKSLSIGLDVVRNFEGAVCQGSKVFVDYCPAGTGGGQGVDVSISPIGGVEITDFVEIVDSSEFDSDIVFVDLVDKEKIWESTCKSNWDCGEWEACEDGVQRRHCEDLSNCAISTDSPISSQRCDGVCVEDWECVWTGCSDGWSSPDCRDKNSCGTTHNIPKKLACAGKDKCVPNVVCEEWSECKVDYDFIDLVGADQVTKLDGGKSRLCVDKKGCSVSFKEEEACSMSVDIYTKRFERCGEEYVGVYNVLDDSTLAILREDFRGTASLNIYFDNAESVYCDYCFDGVLNGDESGVDCGGSCKSCESVDRVYEEKHWWDFLF